MFYYAHRFFANLQDLFLKSLPSTIGTYYVTSLHFLNIPYLFNVI